MEQSPPSRGADLLAQWGTAIAEQKDVGDGPTQDRAHAVLNDVSDASEPVLVVLDNVEDWDEAQRPFPLPQGNHVQILVTTRNRLLGGAHFVSHALETLRPEDARTLLENISGRTPTTTWATLGLTKGTYPKRKGTMTKPSRYLSPHWVKTIQLPNSFAEISRLSDKNDPSQGSTRYRSFYLSP